MRLQPLSIRIIVCLSVASYMLIGLPATATTILSNGMINDINGPSDDIALSNGPGDSSTIANVMAGADISANDDDLSIALLQNSVLLFSGGVAQGDVSVEGNSVAFLQGTATIGGNLSIADNGELQFSDASLVEGDVELDDNATADFSGGTVVGEVVVAGDATAMFTGGTFEDTIVGEDNGVITIEFAIAEDNVEAADDAVIHILGGEVLGSVESVGSAVVNISGGAFPAIFSDGEELVAEGGTIHVTGGVFGEAGVDDGGSAIATVGASLRFQGAEIAGVEDGIAPLVSFSSRLNGVVEISDVAFGDLELEALNGGKISVDDFSAGSVSVTMFAGATVDVEGGEADSLDVFAELGSFINLRGGNFEDVDVTLETDSILTVYGNSFTYLGIPIELLPEDGFIEETGELRGVSGTLAGVLRDGSPFSLSFSRQISPLPGARVFLVQVPEPATASIGLLVATALIFGRLSRKGQA
jgi:hypothetical protein